MNVDVIPSTYDCGNVGDVAMLQVAVSRLKGLWPHASIGVVTSDAEALHRVCPEAKALQKPARAGATVLSRLGGPLWRRLRKPASTPARALRSRRAGETPALVVGSGASSLSDVFKSYSLGVLEALEAAQKRDIPTALLGQGFGPVTDAALLAKARTVLPRVGLIALREGRSGPALLDSIGVDRGRVRVTGDDAVESAFEARREGLGGQVGLNVRVSWNADVHEADVAILKPILQSLAAEREAALLPVPISIRRGLDDSAIQALLDGFPLSSPSPEPLDNPSAVIRQVGRCRIVVTGAYHAAVFALAQGVPALCLYRSAYYRDKFLGLQGLFGAGCSTLELGEGWPERLVHQLASLWDDAPAHRPVLLAAAVRQIGAGRAVLGELPGLLEKNHA